MKRFSLAELPDSFFKVLGGTERSQVAVMTLAPGRQSGGSDNQHSESDQWLLVLAGEGEAVIEGESVMLHEDDLVVIEAGERHEIRNTGDAPLKTVNIYAPKVY